MFSARKWPELILPLGIVLSVLIIFVPLPANVMDFLLTANICAALVILLTTIYVRTPLEFNIFPALLLATTFGRLVLNIATTRMILANGHSDRNDAAGGIIESFGSFVAQDQIVVGLIIFAIILVIQFVVVTKGATRISEVAARFSLDALPGRQMSIDADLNAGLIDQSTARKLREDLGKQTDFYAAMDGASKFVRGDAIAGLLITAINIVGGLVIGISSGMSLVEAGSVFTKLTIGDGLVSQIPAFLIAIAAGLLVTRSSAKTNLPVDFIRQLFARPEALLLAGGFIAMLAFTSMPFVPTLGIGIACVGAAFMIPKPNSAQQTDQQPTDQQPTNQHATASPEQSVAAVGQTQTNTSLNQSRSPKGEPQRHTATSTASNSSANGNNSSSSKQAQELRSSVASDLFEVELGLSLIGLADPQSGGDLLSRINQMRMTIASDFGFVLPKIRIRDNFRLRDTQYKIKLLSNVVSQGELRPGHLLAIDTGQVAQTIPGETFTSDNDSTGVWIRPEEEEKAIKLGYRVLEPSAILAHHVRRIAIKHSSELLTRSATKQLVTEVARRNPELVNDLIPDPIDLGKLHAVLRRLLTEQVPIKQLESIIEAVGEAITNTQDTEQITEHVRQRLARTLFEKCKQRNGTLSALTLSSNFEEDIFETFCKSGNRQRIDQACQQIHASMLKYRNEGHSPVLVVQSRLRPKLSRATAIRSVNVEVLSYDEIPENGKVEFFESISNAT